MKTFWIILLVAFLVFIIIQAIRRRHHSSAEYRARFFSRMPRERHPESNRRSGRESQPSIRQSHYRSQTSALRLAIIWPPIA